MMTGAHGPAPDALQGLVVAVTRPAHQAGPTCAALAAAGAEPLSFPVMEIEAMPASAELAAAVARLGHCRLAVFISANAVHHGLALLAPQGGLPAGVRVAAVGRATARALQEAGLQVDVCPERGFDSEALLATPALRQVSGMDIMLFKGVGGRTLLADTLRARGAKVHYAEVYRRMPAAADIEELAARWRANRLHVIVASSGDSLQFLLNCAGSAYRDALLRTPLAVIGARMLQQARTMGFQSDVIVTEPGDQALVRALVDWRQNANRE